MNTGHEMNTGHSEPEPILFDLETCGLPEATRLLPQPTAPRNYRDPEKIRGYLKAARARQLETASLDPDLGRIVAVGWVSPDTNTRPTVLLARTEAEERDALSAFWGSASGSHGLRTLCGWNIVEFDLPYLLRRSQLLGVEAPRFELTKYRHPNVIDLMQVWSVQGLLRPKPLDFVCRRLGIEIADVGSGRDVAQWVQKGLWENISVHCEADIWRLWAVSCRLGFVSMEPQIDSTRLAVSEPAASGTSEELEPGVGQGKDEKVEAFVAELLSREHRRGAAAREDYLLALRCLEGDGVPQDLAEGARMAMQAGANGYPEAQWLASVIWQEGRGVPQSYEESAAWCQAAAEQEHPDAQLAMGLSYGSGQGVEQDWLEAYRWLALAVGNPRSSTENRATAQDHLEQIESQLTHQELSEARQLVEMQLGSDPEE